MKDRYTKIYQLRREKRMTFKEIGEYMGISRQRAHEIYHRAVKKLKLTKRMERRTNAIQTRPSNSAVA
jgi:RNA polymerase sigma factor (sigma-70 family)